MSDLELFDKRAALDIVKEKLREKQLKKNELHMKLIYWINVII